jgi:hypothetical protein
MSPEEKARAVEEAVMNWLRNNEPSPEDVDAPTIAALTNLRRNQCLTGHGSFRSPSVRLSSVNRAWARGHPAIETFSLETLRVNGHFCGVTQVVIGSLEGSR